MAIVRLYHGTAHPFQTFARPGAGSEPNSALGIHLTEDPCVAAEYALAAARDPGATDPRVLVVDATLGRVALTSHRHLYLGTDPDTGDHVATKADFATLRGYLEDLGFDAAATDCEHEDLVGCHAVFDPEAITIVGSITPEQAMEIQAQSARGGPDYACGDQHFESALGMALDG